jgi:hypothetical protein
MASPSPFYSKIKIYRKIIEISPILKRYIFKIRDISQFRENLSKKKKDISLSEWKDIFFVEIDISFT